MASVRSDSTSSESTSWTCQERLVLVSCVKKLGENNWTGVSKHMLRIITFMLRNEPHLLRPPEFYSKNNCAQEYTKLVGTIALAQKRRRGSETGGASGQVVDQIMSKLTLDRIAELESIASQENTQYKKITKQMDQVKSGKLDHQLPVMIDDLKRELGTEKFESLRASLAATRGSNTTSSSSSAAQAAAPVLEMPIVPVVVPEESRVLPVKSELKPDENGDQSAPDAMGTMSRVDVGAQDRPRDVQLAPSLLRSPIRTPLTEQIIPFTSPSRSPAASLVLNAAPLICSPAVPHSPAHIVCEPALFSSPTKSPVAHISVASVETPEASLSNSPPPTVVLALSGGSSVTASPSLMPELVVQNEPINNDLKPVFTLLKNGSVAQQMAMAAAAAVAEGTKNIVPYEKCSTEEDMSDDEDEQPLKLIRKNEPAAPVNPTEEASSDREPIVLKLKNLKQPTSTTSEVATTSRRTRAEARASRSPTKEVKTESLNQQQQTSFTESIDEQSSRRRARGKAVPAKKSSGGGRSIKLEPQDVPAYYTSMEEYIHWKKSALLFISDTLYAHKWSDIFWKPVTDKLVPGYSKVVKRPVDLGWIKRAVESGEIVTSEELHCKLLQMFVNAVMYNDAEHDVAKKTQEMYKDVEMMIKTFIKSSERAYSFDHTGPPSPVKSRARRTGGAGNSGGASSSTEAEDLSGIKQEVVDVEVPEENGEDILKRIEETLQDT